jgi:deazaflavin-dependent oxidoreductase (nitroreductase family)
VQAARAVRIGADSIEDVPLPRALARFNRRASNHILGPLAHVSHPFAIVVHRGRKSGREYRTPVWAFRRDHGFVIALTYGPQSEWVRNVLARGEAQLIRPGGETHVFEPRIAHGHEGLQLMPGLTRPALRALRVRDFLLLEEGCRGGPRARGRP